MLTKSDAHGCPNPGVVHTRRLFVETQHLPGPNQTDFDLALLINTSKLDPPRKQPLYILASHGLFLRLIQKWGARDRVEGRVYERRGEPRVVRAVEEEGRRYVVGEEATELVGVC